MGPYEGLGELRALVGRGSYALSGMIMTPEEVLPRGALLVQDGLVAAVFEDDSEASKDVGSVLPLPFIIAPGFVDIHIHGGFGVDVYDVLGSPEKLSKLRVELASRGITSFCPTLYTSDARRMAEAAKLIVEHAGTHSDGSRIVGVNFEGPFISRTRAGAQDPRFIVEPNLDLASTLVEPVLGGAQGGLGCIMTVAPEVEGGLELGRSLSERGVVVSAGHSDADYDTAMLAFRSGFTHVTHLYNAMRPFGHRDPGLVGAALNSPEVSVELIVDSHHVDPRVVRSTVKAKGAKRTVIVSDALWVAGLPAGSDLGGLRVEGGVARLQDGTIAGSITLHDGELLVGADDAGIPLQEVVGMLSTTPVQVIKSAGIGEIRVGVSADLVFLDRDTLRVVGSLIGGRQVFANPDYVVAELKTHFAAAMYGEILEQPSRLRGALEATRRAIEEAAWGLSAKPPRIVYFVGSGSSYHAAVSARLAFKRFTPTLSVPVPASEFSSWVGEGEADGGVVVAVSQSGESSDTVGAAKKAKSMGLRVIGVTNNPTSTLAKLSDHVVPVSAGVEMAVTATKSFTASLLSLYALAVEIGRRLGHIKDDEYHAAWLALNRTPDEVAWCLLNCEWRAFRLAKELASAKAVFAMGSGVTYPVALEASLKLKEAANIYAEGFALREFLHGPIQLLDKDTVVVVFEPPTGQGLSEVTEKFAKFGSRVITVSPSAEGQADIPTPQPLQEEFYPIVATIPAQLLALFASLRRGLNPDSPSKLTKVVR